MGSATDGTAVGWLPLAGHGGLVRRVKVDDGSAIRGRGRQGRVGGSVVCCFGCRVGIRVAGNRPAPPPTLTGPAWSSCPNLAGRPFRATAGSGPAPPWCRSGGTPAWAVERFVQCVPGIGPAPDPGNGSLPVRLALGELGPCCRGRGDVAMRDRQSTILCCPMAGEDNPIIQPNGSCSPALPSGPAARMVVSRAGSEVRSGILGGGHAAWNGWCLRPSGNTAGGRLQGVPGIDGARHSCLSCQASAWSRIRSETLASCSGRSASGGADGRGSPNPDTRDRSAGSRARCV